MIKSNGRELVGKYMAMGFIAGLATSILSYSLVLAALHIRFTFGNLADLHHELILVYLVDAIPLAGILVGYLLALNHNNLVHEKRKITIRQERMNQELNFVIQALTNGNLQAVNDISDLDPKITNSLEALQSRLQENRDTERKVREEDKQQNWISEGLAEFGDILRANSTDRDALAYAIISKMVRYLDINQGGFFVIDQPEKKQVLRMIACHAYDRRKYPDQVVEWGEGLIGAVAIEKKSYYTNKIPDGYLHITSGLGRANPRHLLLVPIVVNDEVYGVFELASFKEIPDFQVRFVERVAENTATTLNIMYSNLRTEALLEETREQASELVIQEEKVRRNIEELKITQAEAARQSEQFISFTNTVNHTLIRAEYSTDGTLIYANTRLLRKLGYSGNREVEGKHISMFIHTSDQEWFSGMWNKLSKGGAHFEGYMRHVTKMGLDLWTMATYTCMRKDDGEVEKILFLAIDYTTQKEESLNYEGQIKAINKLSPKAEFSPDGRILEFNSKFTNSLKYTEIEVRNKNIFDFIARSDQERFNEIWEKVITGNSYEGQLRMLSKYEDDTWFRATFSAISDMYGEIEKIVFLAFDISKEKELEYSMRDQNQQLLDKEEEMKLQSLDLKNKIREINKKWTADQHARQQESDLLTDIIDSHPEPIIGINNEGFVNLFNKEAEKFFHTKKPKVIKHRSHLLFHPEQEDPLMEALVVPGRKTSETVRKKIKFTTADKKNVEACVSLLKSNYGSGIINTLIIHPEFISS